VHHSISVYWNQHDALFIQFIDSQRPLHVSSITCSSSGGATQTAFGILRAYNVSWLWHGFSVTATVPQPTTIKRTQYTKRRLCSASWGWASNARTCRGPWFSINWMKTESRWFHYTDINSVPTKIHFWLDTAFALRTLLQRYLSTYYSMWVQVCRQITLRKA
jgi:hypothetical protein